MEKRPLFKGVATALVTPFDENGIDLGSFGRMLEYQIKNGADALVICGTTGESATLSFGEKCELTAFAAEKIDRRVPLIVGTGGNDTARACRLSKRVAALGADALLLVTPYYNKCTQQGLVGYYREVSECSELPFIAYNVPSRTGVRIEPETASEIASLPLAAGYKDAGDSISDTARTIALCGEGFPVYSGNDDRVVPVLSLGGAGVISVVSNVFPARVKSMCDSFFKGDTVSAAKQQLELLPLAQALFCEVNPIPVKAALAELGFCKNILRAPLTALSEPYRESLVSIIEVTKDR